MLHNGGSVTLGGAEGWRRSRFEAGAAAGPMGRGVGLCAGRVAATLLGLPGALTAELLRLGETLALGQRVSILVVVVVIVCRERPSK